MRLLPFISDTHYSPLPPAEVLRRVGQLSVPDGRPWPAAAAPPFRGRVWADSFRLDRAFDTGQVMAAARVWGRVRPATGRAGSTVRLRYGLYPSMLAFASVWMTGVSVGVVASAAQLVNARMVGSFSLIPFGMFLFGLFFFNAPFRGEVAELRVLLTKELALETGPISVPPLPPPPAGT